MADDRVYIVTRGCDKNAVDSERMMGNLLGDGFIPAEDPSDADVIIVNTCCFIEEAKKDSIETIFDYLPYKTEGKCHSFIVAGCMSERYADELQKELPEVDAFVGVNRLAEIAHAARNAHSGEILTGDSQMKEPERDLSNEGTTAYIKISEGCDNHCTYCVIPQIRGRHKSRMPDEIITEAKKLYDSGVRELILIAEDLTQYGNDLDEDIDLAVLLDRLASKIPFPWIRLLYLYPEGITDKLLSVIQEHENVLRYFDMPIQHTEDKILKRMGRHIDKKALYQKISQIRNYFPDAVLRTTLIVGFPGETDQDFDDLLSSINELSFERLGAFAYSREENTPAYDFPDQIDQEVKEERLRQVYQQQEAITAQKNWNLIGHTLEVLIDEIDEDGVAIGRTRGDAPEVDGSVIIEKGNLIPGNFYQVNIVDSVDFDLIGEV